MVLFATLALTTLVAVSIQPVPSNSDTTWCASPRVDEPLLRDARFEPARGVGRPGPDSIYINLAHLPRRSRPIRVPSDSIQVVRDESVCRRAAHLYADLIREESPDWTTKPVLIVRVGSFYLVDDQRSRDGASPVWEVHVFDHNWEYVIRYGEGA